MDNTKKFATRYAAELKAEAVRRAENGERVVDIAEDLKVHQATINNWRRKKRPSPSETSQKPNSCQAPPQILGPVSKVSPSEGSLDIIDALRGRIMELESENHELKTMLDRRTRALAEISTRLALDESVTVAR